MLNRILVSILSLFFLSTGYTYAQQSMDVNILWQEPTTLKYSKYDAFKRLSFQDCIYESSNSVIPYHRNRFKGGNAGQRAIVNLQVIEVVEATSEEKKILNTVQIPEEFKSEGFVEIERKVGHTAFHILPVRINKSTGNIEKLVKARVTFTYENIPEGRPKTQNWASQSVLSSGTWYRMGVTSTGVHKINRSQLIQMGIPANADPRYIKIFGNGGRMLPNANSAERPDDLTENAIYVRGENDGNLDNDDFILFYAQGSVVFDYNASLRQYVHQKNVYTDTAYYFITYNTQSLGKRLQSQGQSNNSVSAVVNQTHEYQVIDNDEVNFIKSGSLWVGNEMNFQNSTSFSFNTPFPVFDTLKVNAVFYARHNSATNLNVSLNGASIGAASVSAVSLNYTDTYARSVNFLSNVITNGQNFNFTVTRNTSGSTAWMDYFIINYRRALSWSSGFNWMGFRESRFNGANTTLEYRISNASNGLLLWDVSDLRNIKSQLYEMNGNVLTFRTDQSSIKDFVLLNENANFQSPFLKGFVANQNLHGLSNIDYVIVSPSEFLSKANELASYHQQLQGLSTLVVTPQQIYNEFSSGQCDVSAIRNFMKMLYDRAANVNEMPKNLLFLARSSYDMKNIRGQNGIVIPTFQVSDGVNPTGSHCSDDYFVLLDDTEGAGIFGNLDAGVGRFTISTTQQFDAVFNKMKSYIASENTMRDWRNVITLVADDEDNNAHINQSENQIANQFNTQFPVWNLDKIYLDAYQQQNGAGGQLYPDVNTAIDNRVQKGTLLFNYIGHGGEESLALERIVTIPQINSYTNFDRLGFWVTATCEFTRLDDPSFISAGEYLFTNPNGGAIGLYTTTRLAFSGETTTLSMNLFSSLFNKLNNEYPDLGEAYMKSKNTTGLGSFTSRVVFLVGDPAMKLAYPKYNVVTTAISRNGGPAKALPDTMRALDLVKIFGEVRGDNGELLSDFNGICTPTVFDKKVTLTTLGNDASSLVRPFTQQKNVIYKGDVSVVNGKFAFEFIVPQDIQLQTGQGKISYYARKNNSLTDAHGSETNLMVGGINPNAIADNTGPQIELYMNNEQFVFGGMTDENPDLYAILSDSSGINTVGTGIGHDITAVLDNKTNETIILNDFYKADLDNFRRGTVRYPFRRLTEGRHTLRVKAWDVMNNAAEGYTEFVVVKNAEAALQYVLNYPNPFTTSTQFMFNHNQPGVPMDVQVQIFTISGKIVKSLETTMQTDGFRSEPIAWNGLDEYGDRIGRGVYIYRLRIKTQDGKTAEKMEKLVILN